MKVGDLVSVVETLGSHSPPRNFRDRGMGIILKITKTNPISYGSFDELYLGDDVTVALVTGEIEVFCERSVKVFENSK